MVLNALLHFLGVTYDCLAETAGGLLWVMLAAGAGAIDADEDILQEL